jgi:hypothetical protein
MSESERRLSYRQWVRDTRVANGMTPIPSFRETMRHLWCMIGHGAHHEVDEIHPQSTMVRISCHKCRVIWNEPKV